MGEGTSRAVAQVEQTRARLDAEVVELQRRVSPMVEQAKRRTLHVAAAGVATVALGGIVLVAHRLRRRRAGE